MSNVFDIHSGKPVVPGEGSPLPAIPKKVWECGCQCRLFYLAEDQTPHCARCGTKFLVGDPTG